MRATLHGPGILDQVWHFLVRSVPAEQSPEHGIGGPAGFITHPLPMTCPLKCHSHVTAWFYGHVIEAQQACLVSLLWV